MCEPYERHPLDVVQRRKLVKCGQIPKRFFPHDAFLVLVVPELPIFHGHQKVHAVPPL